MKEEVIMRKLIADGEGVGEEKRIQQISTFLRDARKNPNGENKISEAVKILKILDGLEMSMLKQKQIAVMNANQCVDFEELAQSVDSEIEETHRKIEEAKQQLAEARVVKRNRQEYSKVVKEINEIPSRAEATKNLSEIRDELERRHEQQKVLESRLNDRRNQLQTLNIVLANMRRFCTEDIESNPAENSGSIENEDDEEEDEKIVVDEWRDDDVQSMETI
ncbi:unnamed protein product [Caenorhabditis angaria]|uniref:THO complex subunit 7 homolog n=1 Tax=Caenorhabditis angaria TaxID=860376 RepID=A0A9P1IN74_9PELO|nr:unnamed protein product [Caenorhabditis angaria]